MIGTAPKDFSMPFSMASAASSPDSMERLARTLADALGAGDAPTVRTGHTTTRLMPWSCANLKASAPYKHLGDDVPLQSTTQNTRQAFT
jgi:hypothetical protein